MSKSGHIIVFTLLVNSALTAQTVKTPSEPNFTLYTSSQLVVLNVGVTDSHGKNIQGLGAQNFKVFEDGRPQAINQFAAEDRPVTVGIVVDASGSMRTKQTEVVAAALSFVGSSNPIDEMFVVNFNDHAFLGLPQEAPFSSDPHQLRAALLRRKPEGKTALYDALALAASHLAKGKWENKAVLLISDGGDNNSTHTFDEAIHAIQRSGATIYTIALFDPEEPEHNLGTLHRLSTVTGGEAFTPTHLSEIDSLCLRIARDIRASYTIAYTPPRPDQHSLPRKIKVVAITGEGGKSIVRTRSSYILEDR